jgi:translation initiation factor 3 subunit D
MKMAASYKTPQVDVNENGWGPTKLPEKFLNVPYAPFSKGDKLGKASDFVSTFAPRTGSKSNESLCLSKGYNNQLNVVFFYRIL